MQTAFEIARALSAVAFLFYGIVCVSTSHMKVEFERYGLARFRVLVGVLECLGGHWGLSGIAHRTTHIAAWNQAPSMVRSGKQVAPASDEYSGRNRG